MPDRSSAPRRNISAPAEPPRALKIDGRFGRPIGPLIDTVASAVSGMVFQAAGAALGVSGGGGGGATADRVRYECDAAGRMTLRQVTRLSKKPDTWRFGRDAEGRLTEVTTPDGGRWRYLYDPFDRRIAKLRLGPDGTTVTVGHSGSGAGPLRIVQHSRTGETYYTWTHYGDSRHPAFVRIGYGAAA